MATRKPEPRGLSPEEEREVLEDLLPGVDIDLVLRDPTNIDLTKQLDAAILKRLLLSTTARTYRSKSGGGGGFNATLAKEALKLIQLDAKVAGGHGTRVVKVPEDPEQRLAKQIDITPQQGAELMLARFLGRRPPGDRNPN